MPKKQDAPELFNYGLFLPSCNGRAGKFLLEDRTLGDYPFNDCVPYLELKYKRRVYKMLKMDEKQLKQLHSKSALKRFIEYIVRKDTSKIEQKLAVGLDPNFHDQKGETPLTIAATLNGATDILKILVAGGAHLDFRNMEGQTPLHKAVFCASSDNTRTLLELGAAPNVKDPLGLTPLYYCMLDEKTNPHSAELLLRDYSNIGTIDMHGNQELHQACKNGLAKHVEHLLYYGADINAKNVNGNTPLHVCCVNNRDACARILLFRGADSATLNNQGQLAYHVAVIVGNTNIAELIRQHDPYTSVPYRDQPKYNHQRRPSKHVYGTSTLARYPSQNSIASSVHASSAQMPRHGSVDYGSIHKYPANSTSTTSSGDEANIPRIMVIPRGFKGFGFILRGTKLIQPGIRFEPTAEIPALQFFEGVDMNGMAMRAGLKPGDFLLEIDGRDVRRANHDQVVQLIQNAKDTITLKVITVVSPNHHQAPKYIENGRANQFGTLPSRHPMQPHIQNNSVTSRQCMRPPLPPQRHPSTSLTRNCATLGRSTTVNTFFNDSNYYDSRMMPAKSMEDLNHYAPNGQRVASIRNRPQNRRISALELEQLMQRQEHKEKAVINRADYGAGPSSAAAMPSPSPSVQSGRYRSVADMKRKKSQVYDAAGQMYQRSNHYEPQTMSSFEPQNVTWSLSQPNLTEPAIDYDDFYDIDEPADYTTERVNRTTAINRCDRSFDNDTSNQQRASIAELQKTKIVKRPKTPPPEAPVKRLSNETAQMSVPPPPPPPMPVVSVSEKKSIKSAPLPPPPPFALDNELKIAPSSSSQTKGSAHGVTVEDLLKRTRQLKKVPDSMKRDTSEPKLGQKVLTKTSTNSHLKSSSSVAANLGNQSLNNGALTLEALAIGKNSLKSTQTTKNTNQKAMNNSNHFLSQRGASNEQESLASPKCAATSFSFDSQLKEALAKRRHKIMHNSTGNNTNIEAKKVLPTVPEKTVLNPSQTRSGLSLRESVRQSVNDTNSNNPSISATSTPSTVVSSGAFSKKDSGYTSSRTSLEPSECGDDGSTNVTLAGVEEVDEVTIPDSPSFPPPPPPEYLNADLNGSSGTATPTKNRVSLLSQHIEDSFGDSQPPNLPNKARNAMRGRDDVASVASTLSTLSSCSLVQLENNTVNIQIKNMTRPLTAVDSGTGDDCSGSTNSIPDTHNDEYQSKRILDWRVGDVCDYLRSLHFTDEHVSAFYTNVIDGPTLVRSYQDRKLMTKLGVTRLAHRQKLEQSMKKLISPQDELAVKQLLKV